MRITFNFFPGSSVLLASPLAAQKASAQDSNKCLYNDVHYHLQNFPAEGPRLSDVLTMMDGHICRTTAMGLAVAVAYGPLIDRSFAPVYYTQTDGQMLYYNAIQDVLVAHKLLALPESDRARVDP